MTGVVDSMSLFLRDLKSRDDNVRLLAATDLRQWVIRESRELPAEAFTRFMNDLNRRIFDLVNSSDIHDKLGGVRIIDELIDVPYEENDTKIIRFANYLRMLFQQNSGSLSSHSEGSESARLMREASRALGHLARAGGINNTHTHTTQHTH